MKTRNPVAGNAWKHNKNSIVPPEKGKKTPYKRVKRVDFEIDEGE